MKTIQQKTIRKNRSHKKILNNNKRHIVKYYKSNMYDYLVLTNPQNDKIIKSLSTKKIQGETKTLKCQKMGEMLSKYLLDNKIKKIVFDKSGYKYHGRIKNTTDTMRKNGINF